MTIRSVFRSLIAVVVLATGTANVSTYAQQPVLIPSPPQVSASSYLLMDPKSGRIIMEDNTHERLPPASLTKMMTAYIVERELDENRLQMSDLVTVSVKAWQTGGSRTFIQEGTQVTVEDLLKGVIIQSGNDASVALAEHIAGTEEAFAEVMNQQALLLGMRDTSFMNATGLPHPEQYSTAFDMALLAGAIVYDYPDNYPLYAEKHFTYNNIRQPNRNALLWRDPSVDGLKTGHTEEAGYCLVASANRDDTRFVAVVMGTSSPEVRAREVQKMLNYGFRYYETAKVFSGSDELVEGRVWGGASDQLSLGIAEDLYLTIPRDSRSKLESVVEVDSVIHAPLSAGDELGTVKVTLGGETLAELPLLALETVPEGGFFKRIMDSVKLFFFQLFN